MDALLSDNAPWPRVIVITGPTASGKSALAVKVAECLGARIISADSRQIYRHIPVTAAVPSAADRARVPHHLVETLELDAYYSAAMFCDDAMALIDDARRRGEQYIVVCGGSMLYIDALLNGIDDLPTISDNVRGRVKQMLAQSGLEGLVAVLSHLDPDYAARVDTANTRRVAHAVEICLQTGSPLTSLLKASQCQRPFKWHKFAINYPRPTLFDRINRRVECMVHDGMEDEARGLLPLRHLNSLNTIGFKEWFAHFDGKMERDTTIARIAKNTRVYAKKQLTWLARDTSVVWLDPTADMAGQIIDTVGRAK